MARLITAASILLLLVLLATSSNGVTIQFKMGPFVSCLSWTLQTRDAIKDFMQRSLIAQINFRCSCQFNSSRIVSSQILCHRDTPNHPTFRAMILSHEQFSETTLGNFVEDWVLQNSATSDGLGYFTIDSTCPVYPNAESAACGEVREPSFSVAVLVGALIAEFVVLIVVFFVIFAIVLTVYSNRLKKRSRDLRKQRNIRKRLNSTVSHDSGRSESRVEPIDVSSMKMQSCSAYATSI